VTVTDTFGATASLTFPIHVSACGEARYGLTEPLQATVTHASNTLLGVPVGVTAAGTLLRIGQLSRDTGKNVRMAVYSDSAGSPDQLVAETPVFSATKSAQEIPVPPVSLAAGRYWVMAVYEVNTTIGIDLATGMGMYKYTSMSFGGLMPTAFPAAPPGGAARLNYWIVVAGP